MVNVIHILELAAGLFVIGAVFVLVSGGYLNGIYDESIRGFNNVTGNKFPVPEGAKVSRDIENTPRYTAPKTANETRPMYCIDPPKCTGYTPLPPLNVSRAIQDQLRKSNAGFSYALANPR